MAITSRSRGARRRIIAAARVLRRQELRVRTTPAANPCGGSYDDEEEETL